MSQSLHDDSSRGSARQVTVRRCEFDDYKHPTQSSYRRVAAQFCLLKGKMHDADRLIVSN